MDAASDTTHAASERLAARQGGALLATACEAGAAPSGAAAVNVSLLPNEGSARSMLLNDNRVDDIVLRFLAARDLAHFRGVSTAGRALVSGCTVEQISALPQFARDAALTSRSALQRWLACFPSARVAVLASADFLDADFELLRGVTSLWLWEWPSISPSAFACLQGLTLLHIRYWTGSTDHEAGTNARDRDARAMLEAALRSLPNPGLLTSLACACSDAFSAASVAVFPNLQSLELCNYRQRLDPVVLVPLRHCLRKLSVWGMGVGDDALEGMDVLQELGLGPGAHATGAGLARLPALEHLMLYGFMPSLRLRDLPRLKHMQASRLIHDEVVEGAPASLQSLTVLSNLHTLTDACLPHIRHIDTLYITIGAITRLTPEALGAQLQPGEARIRKLVLTTLPRSSSGDPDVEGGAVDGNKARFEAFVGRLQPLLPAPRWTVQRQAPRLVWFTRG